MNEEDTYAQRAAEILARGALEKRKQSMKQLRRSNLKSHLSLIINYANKLPEKSLNAPEYQKVTALILVVTMALWHMKSQS